MNNFLGFFGLHPGCLPFPISTPAKSKEDIFMTGSRLR